MKKLFLLILLTGISYATTNKPADYSINQQGTIRDIPDYIPIDDLLFWLPFNGNANDESGNGNNGNVNGATLTADRFGNANSAYNFDGVNDFIQIPHSDSFDIEDEITISFWIKLETPGPGGQPYYIIDKQNSWGIAQLGWKIHFGIIENNYWGPDLLADTYYNLTFTYDREYLKSYINGSIINSIGGNEAIQVSASDIIIGKYITLDMCHFDGTIDDILVYSRALSDSEIQLLYSNTIGCTDPIAINYNPDAIEDDGSCYYLDDVEPHFTPVWSGVPITPMGIYVQSATFDEINLRIGDEIGVFDGNVCVGTVQLQSEITTTIQMIISANNPDTPELDGFFSGHTIHYRYWDASEQIEVVNVNHNLLGGTNIFSPLGYSDVELFVSTILGCTEPDAINFNIDATVNDGSCIEAVYGCPDPEACNYDPEANTDDSSCYYADCAGECGGSAYDDDCGICDDEPENDCIGFDPQVTLILSNLAEGHVVDLTLNVSQNPYEPDMSTTLLTSNGGAFGIASMEVGEEVGFGNITIAGGAVSYEVALVVVEIISWDEANIVMSSTDGTPLGGFVLSNTDTGVSLYAESPGDDNVITTGNNSSITFDGIFMTPIAGSLTFFSTITSELGDESEAQFEFEIEPVDCAGVINGGATVDDCGVCDDDPTNDNECYGCTDIWAMNFDPDNLFDDGSCVYPGIGDISMDGQINVIDIVYLVDVILDGGVFISYMDLNGDGYLNIIDIVILVDIILNPENLGCTDPNAPNYNPEAIFDDGSCEYELFNFATIPSGVFTYGELGESMSIDYNYQIMKFEVTNLQFAQFLNEALDTDEIYEGECINDIENTENTNCILGYYSGDDYWIAGDYVYYAPNGGLQGTSIELIQFNDQNFTISPEQENFPVLFVTLMGAIAFAEHYGLRLPTEQEWEKAARGDTGWNFPWGNDEPTCEYANYSGCYGHTIQVGQTTGVSPYGIYDMAGNVWEWTSDQPNSGVSPIIRGGCWAYNDFGLNTWFQGNGYAPQGYLSVGFRLVRDIEYETFGCTDPDADNFNPDATIDDGSCEYGEDTCTDIDGNVYETVIIGDQEWMAENLKVTHYQNGDEILTDYNDSEWYSLTTGAYAIYNNDPVLGETYGNLYNGFAVEDERGVCPEDWHVPTDGELAELTDYLGGGLIAGSSLKEEGFIHWNPPNTGATNETGFTGLPGGYRSYSNGNYNTVGNNGHFWSSTETNSNNAWNRNLNYNNSNVNLNNNNKHYGFSVRCVRDAD